MIGVVNQMIQLKHFTNEVAWGEIGKAKSDRLRHPSEPLFFANPIID